MVHKPEISPMLFSENDFAVGSFFGLNQILFHKLAVSSQFLVLEYNFCRSAFLWFELRDHREEWAGANPMIKYKLIQMH